MNWRIRGGYDVGTQFFNQVGFPCCTVPLNRMPGQTCLLTFYHPAPQLKCVPRPRHPPCLRLEGQADGIEVITFFACIFNECPAQALGSTTKRIGKVGKLIPPPCEGLIFPGIKMHCRPAKIRQPSKIVKIYMGRILFADRNFVLDHYGDRSGGINRCQFRWALLPVDHAFSTQKRGKGCDERKDHRNRKGNPQTVIERR